MAAYHEEPLILLVPGFAEDSPGDWMRPWRRQWPDCQRLDLGTWDKPHRNTWVNRLNLAIHRAERPVILVAHDIGCLAAVWWAEYERPDFGDPVAGALLVAPPDVDRPGSDARLARFGACPRRPLPFPSFVVADRRAPQSRLVTTTQLASDWDSLFTLDEVDAHGWESGQYLLGRLLRERRAPAPLPEPARAGPVRQPIAA
jgi:predicted alpha/beta hydrolase family esterase